MHRLYILGKKQNFSKAILVNGMSEFFGLFRKERSYFRVQRIEIYHNSSTSSYLGCLLPISGEYQNIIPLSGTCFLVLHLSLKIIFSSAYDRKVQNEYGMFLLTSNCTGKTKPSEPLRNIIEG